MRKRILATILSVCMLIGLLPTVVLADDETDVVTHDVTSLSELIDTIDDINDSADTEHTIIIKGDIEGTISTDELTLDKNNTTIISDGNYTISLTGYNTNGIFKVSSGASLTVGSFDSNGYTLTFTAPVSGVENPMFYVSGTDSTLNMYEGITITDFKTGLGLTGGGVGINTNATFNMYGGEISKISSSGYIYGLAVGLDNSSTFNMYDGTIADNVTTYAATGAGIYARNSSDINIYGGSIAGNSTAGSGGGIYIKGSSALNICPKDGDSVLIDNNTSTNSSGGGGGIYIDGSSSLDISGDGDVTISNNTASVFGGGIFIYVATMTNIENCTISGNTALVGGGILNYSTSTVNVSNSIIDGNIATNYYGGGICNYGAGTVNVSDSSVDGNSAKYGGGILNYGTGTVNVSGSTVDDNSVTYYGGGIYNRNSNGIITITDGTTVNGNKATDSTYGRGAGIYTKGSTTIVNSTINDNEATANGGGIYTTGTTTITGSEIDGNTSTSYGGGIYTTGTTTVTSSEIDGNEASNGGGLFVGTDGTTLSNSTLSNNKTGGIYLSNVGITLDDETTILGNTSYNLYITEDCSITFNYTGEGLETPAIGVYFTDRGASVPFTLVDDTDVDITFNESSVEDTIYTIFSSDRLSTNGETLVVDHFYDDSDSDIEKIRLVLGYTVTYDVGKGDAISSQTVPTGTEITLPNPTQDGYVCTGWKLDSTDYAVGDTYTVTSDATFVAQWSDDVVTNSLAAGTYSTAKEFKLSYPLEDAIIYYKIDDGDTHEYDPTQTYSIFEDCTLTAWAEVDGVKSAETSWVYTITGKYTITYMNLTIDDIDPENPVYDYVFYREATVSVGDAIETLPEDPTLENGSSYYFAGWVMDVDGENVAVTADTIPTSNITVYAVWGTIQMEMKLDISIDVNVDVDVELDVDLDADAGADSTVSDEVKDEMKAIIAFNNVQDNPSEKFDWYTIDLTATQITISIDSEGNVFAEEETDIIIHEITNPDGTLTPIEVLIPFDMEGKENLVMYRYHDEDEDVEAVTLFDVAKSRQDSAGDSFYDFDIYEMSVATVYFGEEDLDPTTTDVVENVALYSAKFSTFAIGYDEVDTSSGSSGSGTSTTYYKIPVSSTGSGSISPDGGSNSTESVAKYSSKTFYFTADEGYTISDVLIDGVSVGAVSSYKFSSITANHTVYVIFAEDIEDDTTTATLNRDDHFAYMQGYVDGTFHPDSNITRAEATIMFSRLLTESMDIDATYDVNFSDMTGDEWYADAVGFMVELGIVTGYTDGTFGGEKSISRAEFATIASRFDDLVASDVTLFSDVDASYWAYRYINSAAEKGWIYGYEDGTFRPDQYIIRAEAVTMVNRVLERNADVDFVDTYADEIKQFSDVATTHWAYYQVMEATNSHDYEKDADGNETWTKLN